MCSSNLRLAKPTDMTTVKDGGFYRLIKWALLHRMKIEPLQLTKDYKSISKKDFSWLS